MPHGGGVCVCVEEEEEEDEEYVFNLFFVARRTVYSGIVVPFY